MAGPIERNRSPLKVGVDIGSRGPRGPAAWSPPSDCAGSSDLASGVFCASLARVAALVAAAGLAASFLVFLAAGPGFVEAGLAASWLSAGNDSSDMRVSTTMALRRIGSVSCGRSFGFGVAAMYTPKLARVTAGFCGRLMG